MYRAGVHRMTDGAATRDHRVFSNLEAPALYEEVLRRHEGMLAEDGAFVGRTGRHTGRSPNDKFIVKEPASAKHIWWGEVLIYLEWHGATPVRRLTRELEWSAQLITMAMGALIRAGLVRAVQHELELIIAARPEEPPAPAAWGG